VAGTQITTFAALGDSFTAGAGCPPGTRWTDRLARSLRSLNPSLVHRNFARDGATSAEVTAQLGPALQLEPDLVTLICGVNDVLYSVRPDIDGYSLRFDSMLERLLESGRRPLVATATAPENLHFLALGPRSERRVRSGLKRLNEETRRVAGAHGVACLEVESHPGLENPANFQADGLHPSPLGHARAAAAFERLLSEHLATSLRELQL
jgi:lysophospholipase L1-like esterase